MAIVDSAGKPITDEIASIRREVNRVFYGANTLRNEDDTLLTRGRGKGLKIYDELKRDAHAGAVLGKRKMAVTSRTWKVTPPTESAADVQAAELVRGALEHLRFNNLCKRLLEATLKGYAVAEVIWEVRDGYWLPKRVVARLAQRFVFNVDEQLRLITREQPIDGEELPPRKFIVHRHGADDDNPYGHGIGSMLFWPVFFKRQDITFWLTFADKFGSPTALGKYPSGAGKSEQDKLLAVLGAISQDAGVIVPEGMLIELIEASRSGSADTYEKLARYMDEQISKAVLGETMSTGAAATGLGSNQADVHNDVRIELAKDDADDLDETLTETLARWIVEFNVPGAGVPKIEHEFAEPEDLTARANRDKVLVEMGFEPTEEYILETYGEGWTKKAPPPAPPTLQMLPAPGATGDPADDPADPAFAEGRTLSQARGWNAQQQQDLADAAEALAGNWRQLVGKRVETLLSMLDDTGDLVQFRERMAELVDADPDPKTVEAIARATFAAHVRGRGQERSRAPPQQKSWRQKLADLISPQTPSRKP
ncbi:MAG: DUF935 family protein [Piscinibacter sp.]|uniref:DUF935 domain-containing protein n=1 Tax=Piscinibacter sp. TaxID=1903157 RepID=UPI00258BA288|nr:DUF935 family protein [Piscinibacter sp.]MCW5666516.1 DUF935 family protein [Piscinibacter sp.]